MRRNSNNSMNSYNHYAFGAVCEWLFEYMAGVRPLEAGFRRILLAPDILVDSEIGSVSSTRGTPYGEVTSSWNREGSTCDWSVKLPPGTTGKVSLPTSCFRGIVVIDEYANQALPVSTEDDVLGRSSFDLPSGSFRISFPVVNNASLAGAEDADEAM